MKCKLLVFVLLFLGTAFLSMQTSFATDVSKAVVISPADVLTTPDGTGSLISKLSKGQEVVIMETAGDWAKVKLDNGIEGYISNLNIEIKQQQSATINALGVNFRAEANPASESIGIFNTGDEILVLGVEGDWASVQSNGIKGYVLRKYLKIEGVDPPVNRGASREVAAILDMAKSLQGKPYVYGSSGPNSFDCSGFVGYVYRNAAGVSLPRVSRDQAHYGTFISMPDLLPGDIVSFDTNGGRNGVSHVGIYIGDGNFIHAASTGVMRVTTDSLYSTYYSNTFMGGSRVLNK